MSCKRARVFLVSLDCSSNSKTLKNGKSPFRMRNIGSFLGELT
jgi:hypothetical protein